MVDNADSPVADKAEKSDFVTISNLESLDDPRLYINRELSLLAFQWRVLEEAQDERNPLLERYRFLSIVGSNIDEFFMVRVAGLKRQLEAGTQKAGPDGLKPKEQLEAVGQEVNRLLVNAQQCLRDSLTPALREAGIKILRHEDLTQEQKDDVEHIFLHKILMRLL